MPDKLQIQWLAVWRNDPADLSALTRAYVDQWIVVPVSTVRAGLLKFLLVQQMAHGRLLLTTKKLHN